MLYTYYSLKLYTFTKKIDQQRISFGVIVLFSMTSKTSNMYVVQFPINIDLK